VISFASDSLQPASIPTSLGSLALHSPLLTISAKRHDARLNIATPPWEQTPTPREWTGVRALSREPHTPHNHAVRVDVPPWIDAVRRFFAPVIALRINVCGRWVAASDCTWNGKR